MTKRLTASLLIFIAFFGLVPEARADITSGIVECWDLNETSTGAGAVTRNGFKGSYNFTDVNTVTSAAGKFGNAASFAAATSETLAYTTNAMGFTNADDDITVLLWAKPASNPTSGNLMTLWATPRASTDPNVYHQLYYYNNAGTLQLLWTRQANNFQNTVSYNVDLNNGSWHHLGLTYDGTSVMRVWYNGAEVASTTTNTAGTGTVNTGTWLGSNAATGLYYNGLLDVPIIYNRNLDSTDIGLIYNSGTGRDCDGIVNYSPSQPEATTTPFMRLQGDVQISGDVIIRR